MGNAFAPMICWCSAGERWRMAAISREGFDCVSVFAYYFIGTIPFLSDPMRAGGKTRPHPSSADCMDEHERGA